MGGHATEKRIGGTGTHRDRILAGEGVIVLERREAHRKENGARRVFGSITPRGDASTGRRAREEWQRPSVAQRGRIDDTAVCTFGISRIKLESLFSDAPTALRVEFCSARRHDKSHRAARSPHDTFESERHHARRAG